MNSSTRLKISLLIVAAAVLAPAVIWLSLGPIQPRFATMYVTARSVGQLTGLVGLAMFSVSLILSARLSLFDRWFAGLDKTYAKHSMLGKWAFVLLMVHPLALAAVYLRFNVKSAVAFLLPWSSAEGAEGGFISLGLLTVLLALTIYARALRYDWWRWSHRFMGVAFAIGLAHALEMESDTARSLVLRSYVIGLGGLAVVAWTYRSILWPWLVRRRNYLVKSLTTLGNGTWSLLLAPRGNTMKFEAGQFAYLSFGDRLAEEHPFTIASSVNDRDLRFGIKELGDWTRRLRGLKPGQLVRVEGPFGAFTPWQGFSRRQVWIAGGIGITPFLSAVASWPREGERPVVDLFYCVRDEASAAFLEELRAFAPSLGSFHFNMICESVVGRINGEAVSQSVDDYRKRDYFLCGPPAMMENITAQLVQLGVPRDLIHFERFSLKP
jgi:predicted ferric reductase